MRRQPLIMTLLVPALVSATPVDSQFPPLFSKVIKLPVNDALNVREKPSHHSRKIGSLPQDAHVGIKQCQKVGKSLWCQVYTLTQRGYDNYRTGQEDHSSKGWVNAYYLEASNEGYVLIDGAANCDYALRCNQGVCDVVTAYETNDENEITKLVIHQYPRDRLTGESHFGTTPGEGYCTASWHINEYLNKRPDK
jgi:hypothetical protein